jgi:methionyl-tRNA synthetase
MAAERSFYVTTPIYYVNAAPHLGHAYTTIAADVMARHHRQRGEDVFFLTGTDEHGEPVADAAKAQGLEPKELADRNAERFKALAPQLEATNDFFIRTSDPEHIRRVQDVLQRVYDNGFVHEGLYEGWYCPRCADFKVENEIEEGNRCPIHHIELERHSEENYFFALSAFQERLEKLYEEHPDFVTPRVRYNEALSFIKSGLKDILRFHTVFWPAMLMAADLPVPEHVFVHGYLLLDGEKMSKSLGNVLDPFEIIERFGTDALRYYLLRDVTFGEDGSVSTEAFERRYDTELANELGNLASRTLAMIVRYRDGTVPDVEVDPALAADFDGLAERVAERIDRVELTPALDDIWQCVRRLNRYVEEQAPWQLAKDPDRAADLDRVLRTLAEGLRVVTVLLSPWIPGAAEKLLGALGATDLSLSSARFGSGEIGAVGPLEPLFPKQQ